MYIIIAAFMLVYSIFSLHFGKTQGRRAPKTTVHLHTSAMMVVLMLAAALIATMATEILLLWIVKRGEPYVKAESSVIGLSDGELQLKWTTTIVTSDNFAINERILYYLLAHLCGMVMLVALSDFTLGQRRHSPSPKLFYAVASLALIVVGVLIFLGEVWPIL